jgi:RNA polymerase sigma factor (sigma-70 family)
LDGETLSSDGELIACAKAFADQSGHPEQACGTQALAQDRTMPLAEVARSHHRALVRFLALRTGSAEDAKEIVQEAYMRVLALDRPGTVSFLVGYLWRIAANLAIDRSRQRMTRARLDSVALQPTSESVPSTESVVELHQRLAIVEKAIGELPSRCRQAFLLRVLGGRRFAQVGREMGITERMAKNHVARAMEYLQRCVDSAEAPRELA